MNFDSVLRGIHIGAGIIGLILGGAPVFAGTRVPLCNLIDFLEAGDSLDDFLDAFPSVSREQAVAVLELAFEALTSSARPA